MSRRLLLRVVPLVALSAALHMAPASAGPPYVTDDPVPTDTGHWEIFTFADNILDHGETATEAGFDINYGPVRDLQLTAVLTLDHDSGTGDTGLADTELGVKYRLVNDEHRGYQIAVFPKIILPTAAGPGRASFELPVWVQQDFGRWSLFGGGGLTIPRDPGTHDFWQAGVALVNTPREGVTVGIETAYTGAQDVGGHGSTTLDVAATFHLAGPLSLVGAVGPVFESHADNTALRGYVGLLTNL